jgi:transposase
MAGDGTGFAEALLGLDGFRVLGVGDLEGEVVVLIETTAERVACPVCGVVAEAQDRMEVEVRDLACFGRPARLRWAKRRWRCREPLCDNKTWTEETAHVSPRSVLTRRAGADACRRVGQEARPVSTLARELGVSWSTVMDAVVEHGTPLVEDSGRVGPVRQLGVDETAFLKAKPEHPTRFVTGLVDLERRVMIDLIEGNTAGDVRAWLGGRPDEWLDRVTTVATDLHESYRQGLSPHLDHARRVADPFHVVGVANRCLDTVRRRVQHETLGHRGRKRDPLYRIRKVLLRGAERLDERGNQRMLLALRVGDPKDEVLGAWLAKESVRDVYLAENVNDATTLLDKAIVGCAADEVPEIQALGRTLASWRAEILAHHQTGASNGPTEALNLLVKKVKRCGHGFRNFEHYRLRVLLHTGGVKWEAPHAAMIRARSPHSFA